MLFNIYLHDTPHKWKEDTGFGIKINQNLILNYLAYVDGLLTIKDKEDRLQKSNFKIQETGKDYNTKISVNKTETMAFIGK